MTLLPPNNFRAFPSSAISPEYGGMELRDWFAGQILSGVIAHGMQPMADFTRDEIAREMQQAAEISYQFADAMIAARSK